MSSLLVITSCENYDKNKTYFGLQNPVIQIILQMNILLNMYKFKINSAQNSKRDRCIYAYYFSYVH